MQFPFTGTNSVWNDLPSEPDVCTGRAARRLGRADWIQGYIQSSQHFQIFKFAQQTHFILNRCSSDQFHMITDRTRKLSGLELLILNNGNGNLAGVKSAKYARMGQGRF